MPLLERGSQPPGLWFSPLRCSQKKRNGPHIPARPFCFYTVWCAFASFSPLMALDDFLLEAEEKMSKTEQVIVNEFAGVRTGKASASLVENVLVDVYGSQMRIRELAGITTPEPRTL